MGLTVGPSALAAALGRRHGVSDIAAIEGSMPARSGEQASETRPLPLVAMFRGDRRSGDSAYGGWIITGGSVQGTS